MSQEFTIYKDDLNIEIQNPQNKVVDCGDIPIATYNEITKYFEPVINNRGHGYASRNNMKFRKNKQELINNG